MMTLSNGNVLKPVYTMAFSTLKILHILWELFEEYYIGNLFKSYGQYQASSVVPPDLLA